MCKYIYIYTHIHIIVVGVCANNQIEHCRGRSSDSSSFPTIGPAQPLQFLRIRRFHDAVARHFGLAEGMDRPRTIAVMAICELQLVISGIMMDYTFYKWIYK